MILTSELTQNHDVQRLFCLVFLYFYYYYYYFMSILLCSLKGLAICDILVLSFIIFDSFILVCKDIFSQLDHLFIDSIRNLFCNVVPF